jgi:hypothetical protein
MAGLSFNQSTSLPNSDTVLAPYGGNTAIPFGELMYFDNASGGNTGYALPCTSMSDQNTLSANQLLFASMFLGVCHERKLATDDITLNGASKTVEVAPQFVGEFDCTSSTFRFGDMVGADETSAGTALKTRTVIKVTDPLKAIGFVLKTYAAATTRVLCCIYSRVLPTGGLPNTSSTTGTTLSLSSTLAVTGATTLTGDLTESGNATIGGTFGVTGASTFTGAVGCSSTLTVAGATALNGLTSMLSGALNAAGNQQSNAAAIVTNVVAVAAADNTKGVKLPAPASAKSKNVYLRNTSATSTLKVYPNSTEKIDGGNASESINVAATKSVLLFSDGTDWFSLLTA